MLRALLIGSLVLPSVAVAANPTFNKDIAPILFKHCANCHRPNDIGPFSLLTYADAKKRAKQVAHITAQRTMPPWMPHATWGEFKYTRTLSAEQIALFQKWADTGMTEGLAKDLPPTPQFKDGWQLGQPDLILKMDKPFTVPAEGRDVYHHFVFPLNLPKDTYLKGIEVLPGNRRVAHHAVGILDTGGTARRLAQKHDGAGYPSITPGFLPAGFTPGYAPGQGANLFGADEALTLKKGTDFVLQMHYSPTGKEETDQTQVGLYFTKTPPKRNIGLMMLGSVDIDIPPGDRAYTRTDTFKVPVDFEVRNIWAHMHLIGKEVKVWAELPDGKQKSLLWINDWNFNWQESYQYTKPFILPKNTLVKAKFVWDNSADNPRNPHQPPQRVRNGEQSADEMGGLIVGGRTVYPWDELGLWGGVIGHYFEIESKKKR
jgi:hypothetical protein